MSLFSQTIIQVESKKIISFLFIFVLIVGNVNFISPQEKTETFGEKILRGIYSINDLKFSKTDGIRLKDYSKTLEIYDTGSSMWIYFLSNGKLPPELNYLWDITPQSETNRLTYIKINEINKRIYEADITIRKDERYIFGNNYFYAPKGSRIIFKNETLQIIAPENSTFSELPSLIDPKVLTTGVEIKGKNILLPNGLKIIDGRVNYGLEGYKVLEGQVDYQNMLLIVRNPSEQVLISNGLNKNPEGNYILQGEKLRIQSVKGGVVNIKFLPGEKMMNIEQESNLLMQIKNGDGLEITKVKNSLFQEIPSITHLSSQKGSSLITNGNTGTLVYTKDDVQLLKEDLEFGLPDNIGRNEIPLIIKSNSKEIDLELEIDEKEKMRIGKEGDKYGATFNKDSIERLDGFSYLDLKKNYGEDWDEALLEISWKMRNGQLSYKTLRKLYSFAPDSSFYESSVSAFENIKKNGFSDKESLDFISKMQENSPSRDETVLMNNLILLSTAKNLNGKNLKMAYSGIFFTSEFLSNSKNNGEILSRTISDLNLDFSEIKDKTSLAKSIANSLNNYECTSACLNEGTSAYLINSLHDLETEKTGTDTIRETIIQNLDTKKKYELISRGTRQLYTSSFLKIANSLPGNIVQEIEKVDPSGKDSPSFVLNLASRDYANPLIKESPSFFLENAKKSIENLEKEKKILNFDRIKITSYLTSEFKEYFDNPSYDKEKKELENFLIDQYNQNDRLDEEKAPYGYLLKLDENPINPLVKQIASELPSLPTMSIPTDWIKDNTISMKEYFYVDEGTDWFGQTTKTLQSSPYNMKIQSKDADTVELTKQINGKIMRIVLTTDNSDVDKTISGNEFDIIAHRSHSYYLEDTFNTGSSAGKLLYLGSCGSSCEVPRIQGKYPNSYIISDKDTGEGTVNNYVSYYLMEKIAEGKTNWNDLKPSIAEASGIIFPDEEDQLLSRFVLEVMNSKK